MLTRFRINPTSDFLLVVSIVLLAALLVMFAVCVQRHINAKPAIVISSGENVTKLNDVADLKRRMKFHGCLCCQKDLEGVWWFYRDGKLCKL